MADQPTTPDSSSRPDSREPNWERAALERIALAAVKEQRAARRWKIFFRFAFLGVFALLAFALIDFSATRSSPAGATRRW
jgi:protease-4